MTTTVERINPTGADEVIAICRRGRTRQRIDILELPLPGPPPAGAEWIEAYRYWARGRAGTACAPTSPSATTGRSISPGCSPSSMAS